MCPAAKALVAPGNPFGLRDSFAHEYTALALHAWILHKRLRKVYGRAGADLSQELHGFMNEDVEMRVYKRGVRLRASHWNKQLENQFYLICSELDVAMAEPDTVTDVLRKRVYAFDVEMDAEEDVSEQQGQALAHYLHETHLALANTDATALMQGEIRFRGPGGEAGGGEIAQQASS